MWIKSILFWRLVFISCFILSLSYFLWLCGHIKCHHIWSISAPPNYMHINQNLTISLNMSAIITELNPFSCPDVGMDSPLLAFRSNTRNVHRSRLVNTRHLYLLALIPSAERPIHEYECDTQISIISSRVPTNVWPVWMRLTTLYDMLCSDKDHIQMSYTIDYSGSNWWLHVRLHSKVFMSYWFQHAYCWTSNLL